MKFPLFILCNGRAFSSVVASAIGQHPEMCGMPEMNFLVGDTIDEVINRFYRNNKRYMLHGTLRVLAQLHDGEQTEETVEYARAWLKDHRHWTTEYFAHYIAELIYPRRFVEKSPTNAISMKNLERLYRSFPHANILHMTRHPRGVGNSLFRAHTQRLERGFFDVTLLMNPDRNKVEKHYITVNSNISKFTSQLPEGQAMHIRGEELLSDPDLYFRQIAEWLGIDAGKDSINAMKHPEDSPYACVGASNAKGGHNAGFLKNPKLRVGNIPEFSLEGELEWYPGTMFSEPLIRLARKLGYQ
jgi:hypothetical protein